MKLEDKWMIGVVAFSILLTWSFTWGIWGQQHSLNPEIRSHDWFCPSMGYS